MEALEKHRCNAACRKWTGVQTAGALPVASPGSRWKVGRGVTDKIQVQQKIRFCAILKSQIQRGDGRDFLHNRTRFICATVGLGCGALRRFFNALKPFLSVRPQRGGGIFKSLPSTGASGGGVGAWAAPSDQLRLANPGIPRSQASGLQALTAMSSCGTLRAIIQPEIL